MKKILKFCCYFLLRILFPVISFEKREYPLFKMIVWGLRQRIFSTHHRSIPWPVHPQTQIKDYKKISLGTLAPGLSIGCYLDARNGIVFEENVWLGPRVSIISMNHDLCDYDQYLTSKPVRIGRNSLIATNAVILPGVELGEHTVVAAGSIVTKSFLEGNVLLAGNPAKIVKRLYGYSVGSES